MGVGNKMESKKKKKNKQEERKPSVVGEPVLVYERVTADRPLFYDAEDSPNNTGKEKTRRFSLTRKREGNSTESDVKLDAGSNRSLNRPGPVAMARRSSLKKNLMPTDPEDGINHQDSGSTSSKKSRRRSMGSAGSRKSVTNKRGSRRFSMGSSKRERRKSSAGSGRSRRRSSIIEYFSKSKNKDPMLKTPSKREFYDSPYKRGGGPFTYFTRWIKSLNQSQEAKEKAAEDKLEKSKRKKRKSISSLSSKDRKEITNSLSTLVNNTDMDELPSADLD